jgi:DNA-binding transcriptional LysR family regulator
MFNDLFNKGGLSLDRLRSFCAVAAAGGVTKAAGGDATRQSQFSRQIKELETFFGIELTRRQGKGIVLSAAGIRLAKIARESMSALNDFHLSCKNEPLEFSIGAGDALLQWLLFPRIAQLHNALPSAAFDVQSLRTLDTVERINDFRLDFGLIRKDTISPLHKCESLGFLTYSLFAPVALLPKKANAHWKEVVAKLPLATIAGEGAFRANLEKEATNGKFTLRFSLSCSSFPQAAMALQSGCYAAILPSIAATELDSHRFSQIPAPFLARQSREICLAWNRRMADLRPATIEAKNCISKLLRLPAPDGHR